MDGSFIGKSDKSSGKWFLSGSETFNRVALLILGIVVEELL
jgi:hypothetical protein